MKASLSWLNEYTKADLPAQAMADLFTNIGLEVEGVGGQYVPQPGVVVGKVLSTQKHPNADRLSLNRVDLGAQTVDIVCGAPNVRPGLTVAVVRPGSTLPSGLAIRESKIRGVVSHGMICSEAELLIGEDHSGIMELRSDAPAGEAFAGSHYDLEPVFDIAVLPNRPDCLSVFGLARELAAKLGRPLSFPRVGVPEAGPAAASKIRVDIKAPAACPRYSARYIHGVKIGPSPAWLVKRLKAVGLRPINNVVDVTNFVLMELGHPLHAFDYGRVAGGRISVRAAEKGEKFTTLDNTVRELRAHDLLICDAERPVALAGVMGGLNSEVSEGTTEILLESAYFEPVGIRKTARRLGIQTESSYRFERGADPNGLVRALDRAAALICELAGGKAGTGVVDVNPGNIQACKVRLRTSRLNRVLGTALSAEEIKEVLGRLGMICGRGEDFDVTVPTWRPDVTREADLIEEVIRITGYDKVESNVKSLVGLYVKPNAFDEFREKVRHTCAGLGLSEVVTNSLSDPGEMLLVNPKAAPVALLNPLSPETSVLRTSMVPSLLSVAKGNFSRNIQALSIFEIGRTFIPQGQGALPFEKEIIACLLTGARAPLRWDGKNEAWDFYHARGLVETLLLVLTGAKVAFERAEGPGAGFNLKCGNDPLGRIQAVPGEFLRAFDLKGDLYYFEIDFAKLFGIRRKDIRYRPVSKFPPSDRDMAVVVPESADVNAMLDAIRAESPFIEQAAVFDVFKSKDLGPGRKSVAFSMRLRKPDGTLTDPEVDAIFKKAVRTIERGFEGVLRT